MYTHLWEAAVILVEHKRGRSDLLRWLRNAGETVSVELAALLFLVSVKNE